MLQKILPKYTSNKDGILYYVRRVPKPVRNHYRLPIIRISLRTRHSEIARKRAEKINTELERDWEQLMYSSVSDLIGNFRRDRPTTTRLSGPQLQAFDAPSITEAMEFYFSGQGADRSEEFFRAVRRAVSYLCEAVGDLPITYYSRKEAKRYRKAFR